MFAPYHYLSGSLLNGAQCWGGFLGDRCVAFNAVRHFAHPRIKNAKMGHRLVVLPEFQGLGIGGRLDDIIGQLLYEQGYRYRNCIAHPAMIRYYATSPRWRLSTGARKKVAAVAGTKALLRVQSDPRVLLTRTFEYVPPAET